MFKIPQLAEDRALLTTTSTDNYTDAFPPRRPTFPHHRHSPAPLAGSPFISPFLSSVTLSKPTQSLSHTQQMHRNVGWVFFCILPYHCVFVCVCGKLYRTLNISSEPFLSVQLSGIMFTLRCDHHHHPSPQLFASCETETLYPLNDNSPSPSSQPLATTPLLSVSMDVSPLSTSHKWDHTVFLFLWLTYLT